MSVSNVVTSLALLSRSYGLAVVPVLLLVFHFAVLLVLSCYSLGPRFGGISKE
jgi:hypothetical protein